MEKILLRNSREEKEEGMVTYMKLMKHLLCVRNKVTKK